MQEFELSFFVGMHTRMGTSKSLTHWQRLAQLLGAQIPDEPAPVEAEHKPELIAEPELCLLYTSDAADE